MTQLIIKILLGLSLGWLVACGPGYRPNPAKTQNHVQSVEGEDEDDVAPLLKQDEKISDLPTFTIPEVLRDRLKDEIPEYVPAETKAFEVTDQKLKINVKTKTITFSGTLKIKGKPDEAIELSCPFDPAGEWVCGNMFPTDKKVAAERRLQAAVRCMDTYRCDQVGLELFVVVNGKTESQLFQSQRFETRRATSGDIDEDLPPYPDQKTDVKDLPPFPKEKDQKKDDKLPPFPKEPEKKEPKIFEKPTPQRPPRVEAPPPMNEEELKEIIDDPNFAIEITPPLPVPAPVQGEYSIPDIEKLRPEEPAKAPNQAIGAHANGYLRNPSELPEAGMGYVKRNRANRGYGTERTIKLVTYASAAVATMKPQKPPVILANISKKTGGRLCNGGSCHKSHQTGLDIDIVYPSRKEVGDMWNVCERRPRRGCAPGARISPDFDEERFWLMASHLTCADGNPVIAMFVDTEIKKHMCKWIRENIAENLNDPNSCAHRTLKAMKYSPGHHNHFHVRFRCPGNRDCRNSTVSLGRGTGC